VARIALVVLSAALLALPASAAARVKTDTISLASSPVVVSSTDIPMAPSAV